MMRKILFFSASENVKWNDGEQVWADLAMYMLNRGYDIVVNTIETEHISKELEAISSRGGVLTSRPNVHVNGKATDIANNRILDYKWKATVLDFQPDAIFVSGSGEFDYALRQHGEWLFALDKPVFVLAHNQQELSGADNDAKEYFQHFFSQCEKVLFVNEVDKNYTEAAFSQTLSNSVLVNNAVSIKETTPAANLIENLADVIISAKVFVNA